MNDSGGPIGNERSENPSRQIEKDKLAAWAEVLELLFLLAFLLILSTRAGQWLPPGPGEDGLFGLGRRVGREDAVGHECHQEQDEQDPGVIEVNHAQELLHARGRAIKPVMLRAQLKLLFRH